MSWTLLSQQRISWSEKAALLLGMCAKLWYDWFDAGMTGSGAIVGRILADLKLDLCKDFLASNLNDPVRAILSLMHHNAADEGRRFAYRLTFVCCFQCWAKVIEGVYKCCRCSSMVRR